MGEGNRLAHIFARSQRMLVGLRLESNDILDIIVVRASEEMYEHLESI